MIAIFSKEDFDDSTCDVIDWLDYYGAEYVRINGLSFFESINFTEDRKIIEHEEDINVCWFRRWLNDQQLNSLIEQWSVTNLNLLELSGFILSERNSINGLLWSKLRNKKWLTNPYKLYKKLDVLSKASDVGLDVPSTIITSSKSQLVDFFSKKGRIITKPISDTPFFADDEFFYSLKTIEVKEICLKKYPECFFPSLFQELIDKQYELRIFFLEDNLYSMAIFSQLDVQTSIDFRNYNHAKPNRCVPYQLPQEVEIKLKSLIKLLDINTGSIDIIKSKDGKYIFLEINQAGQFGMTSLPCNYYLEKHIANFLNENDY